MASLFFTARPAAPPAPSSPVKRVLAFGEEGTNPGQLHAPTQLAVSSDGSIPVAENTTGRVQRFGADGAYQAAVVMPPDNLTKQGRGEGVLGQQQPPEGEGAHRSSFMLEGEQASLHGARVHAVHEASGPPATHSSHSD